MTFSKDFDSALLTLLQQIDALPQAERRNFAIRKTLHSKALQTKVLELLDQEPNDNRANVQTGGGILTVGSMNKPEQIGDYLIRKELGRGGMGVVYLAEKPHEDFEHLVAIKLISSFQSNDLILDFFRRERRLLAILKHPNIVQFYDGGETDIGLPYFVMEYIDGQTLLEWLEAESLSLEDRFKCFEDICAGLSYAHNNGIIHKDLSPTNIIVSSEGLPKIVDFGVAEIIKANSHNPTDNRSPHTVQYTAPERLLGHSATTRTDIWSLGRLLGDMFGDIKLPRQSDFDAIRDKACAKDPDQRYSSVDFLKKEIAAYRDGYRVLAADTGLTYRLTRFVQRRPWTSASVVTFITFITGALISLSILLSRTLSAEQLADNRFNQVRSLAGFMMTDLHDSIEPLNGSTPAREQLVKRSLSYLNLLDKQTAKSEDLKLELAEGYLRLAEVTGNAGFSNIGNRTNAANLIERSRKLLDSVNEMPPNPRYSEIRLKLLIHQALQAVLSDGEFAKGISFTNTLDELYSEFSKPTSNARLSYAYAGVIRSYAYLNMGKYDLSFSEGKKALLRFDEIGETHVDRVEFLLHLAKAHSSLGETIAWQIYERGETDYHRAIPYFDEGVNSVRKLLDTGHKTARIRIALVIGLLKRANTTCYTENRLEEGLSDMKEAQIIIATLLETEAKNTRVLEHAGYVAAQKSECLFNAGKPEEAINVGKQAVWQARTFLESEPHNSNYIRQVANNEILLSYLHQGFGEAKEACEAARRSEILWLKEFDLKGTRSSSSEKKLEESRALQANCK